MRGPDRIRSELEPIWCRGCGNYGILNAFCRALDSLEMDPDRVVVVSGIGCSGRFPWFVRTYGFHVVHGRVLPVATGIKLANPSLSVIGVSGDGDAFAIGGGHIIHAARRNVDIAYLVFDNFTYGQTRGQASPTSDEDRMPRHALPYGLIEEPLNPIALAIAYDVSFVARGFSGDVEFLSDLIAKAISHKGFAMIDIISPCYTFNNTWDMVKEKAERIGPEHDPTDRAEAFKLAIAEADRIYMGIFYVKEKPTLGERLMMARRMESPPPLEEMIGKLRVF
jgi:2-oxoglutarate ferredoxin oxidoreductase subunit beta